MKNKRSDVEKKPIIQKMKEMSFVKWDRLTRFKDEINAFGWIERNDNYKDFVVLSQLKDGGFWFITSSKNFSSLIHEIVFKRDSYSIKHNPCERVEDVFKEIDNCVKLKK